MMLNITTATDNDNDDHAGPFCFVTNNELDNETEENTIDSFLP